MPSPRCCGVIRVSDSAEAVVLEHPDMIYADFVEHAMRSEEPVTETRSSGEDRTIYSAAQYDPDAEMCWRADIAHDTRSDGSPRVTFSKCRPTADHETLRDWSPLATGRLSGPQRLPAWEALFTVFNTVLAFYRQEQGDRT